MSVSCMQVNLKTGVPQDSINETCTAGAGSLLVEFGILSRLIGDSTFEWVARRAVRALWNLRSNETGLLGKYSFLLGWRSFNFTLAIDFLFFSVLGSRLSLSKVQTSLFGLFLQEMSLISKQASGLASRVGLELEWTLFMSICLNPTSYLVRKRITRCLKLLMKAFRTT